MNKLIPGGIYTNSNTNLDIYKVFVFVGFNKENNLIFLTVPIYHDDAQNVKFQIESIIKHTGEKYLLWNRLSFTENRFGEICDGFLGVVNDESLERLKSINW